MPRTGYALIALALAMFAGCQAPGFDPLGLQGPQRVPPPPTGAVGNGYGSPGSSGYPGGYYEPVPQPNVGQGASNWPNSNYLPHGRSSDNGFSQDQFAASELATVPAPSRPIGNGASSRGQYDVADSRPTLRPTSEPQWIDLSRGTGSATPGLLPATGQTQPIVTSAPRVRGFRNSNATRDLQVPRELADFRGNGYISNPVRQASAAQRYDDVRR